MSHKLCISLLLISLLMLSGCPGSGSSSGSNSTNDITDNSPGEPPGEEPPIEEPFEVGLFTLEETTMDQVHEALAGRRVLEDGSPVTCESLAQMYIDRIYAFNDAPQPANGLPVRGVLAINRWRLSRPGRWMPCMPAMTASVSVSCIACRYF
ncbi:hypothetical protein [Marinobacter similis]|uniref:Uncharacterized protein n=1 Tax=Marinobacter similis TaxID=1420916 RepID=W5YUK9_9GAMM|nr:hypothetical protein [Marinobacter similis]AHI30183.1 hypothetical protein AU14_14790 [Marinobacter similis]